MPIGAIIDQPISNGLKAAYRPVILRVAATKTDNTARPPVVYCDIYFNNIFYKTLSKTQYALLNLANSEWQFDIQDAAQEYLKKFLGNNGEAAIVEAAPIITVCFCRFRSSGIDTDGFIATENTSPIQATSSSEAVSGTGTDSNTFYILNATLQHEDAQDLALHLSSFKKRTWAANTYPLTHRPDNYKLCVEDSDIFPIVHEGNDLACIVLNYKNKGQSSWNTSTNCAVVACPIPSEFTIFVFDNLDGTQEFTFNWNTVPSPTAQLDIQCRRSGSTDPWTSNVGSIIPTRDITLPLGLYDFRIQGVGDCASAPGGIYEGYGYNTCVPIELAISPVMPDAQAGVPYHTTVYYFGTLPFALANVVKPDWMFLTIVGMAVEVTGTPSSGDVGEGFDISWDVTNCSGKETASWTDNINVNMADPSSFFNNSASTFGYKIIINGTVYSAGTILPGQTINFTPPELPLGAGLDLTVYTSTLLMTTCTAQSNSVNIPMVIDTSGPGTNNVANNLTTFAIVNGLHITVT